MIFDPLKILTLLVACVGLLVFIRLIVLGIVEAWLPVVCLVAYLLLELDWIFTAQEENIGELRNTAWSLVEIGLIGGSVLVIHRLKETFRNIARAVREALDEDTLHEDEGGEGRKP